MDLEILLQTEATRKTGRTLKSNSDILLWHWYKSQGLLGALGDWGISWESLRAWSKPIQSARKQLELWLKALVSQSRPWLRLAITYCLCRPETSFFVQWPNELRQKTNCHRLGPYSQNLNLKGFWGGGKQKTHVWKDFGVLNILFNKLKYAFTGFKWQTQNDRPINLNCSYLSVWKWHRNKQWGLSDGV